MDDSSSMLTNLLTPQFFDALIIGVIIAGLILAVARIIHDFRSGSRWPEPTHQPNAQAEEEE